MSTYLEHGVLCDRRALGLGQSLLATYQHEPDDHDLATVADRCPVEEPHQHHVVCRVVTLGDWSEPLATEAAS